MKPEQTSDVVFKTPYFRIETRRSRTGSDPHYVVIPPDYVTVLAVTDQHEILMVRQYRPVVDQMTLELPSGHVDPGETAKQSAYRELQEETGFNAKRFEFLGDLFVDSGRLGNKLVCFYASGLEPIPGAKGEAGIELLKIPVKELSSLVARGEYQHAPHLAVLYLAQAKGLLTLL